VYYPPPQNTFMAVALRPSFPVPSIAVPHPWCPPGLVVKILACFFFLPCGRPSHVASVDTHSVARPPPQTTFTWPSVSGHLPAYPNPRMVILPSQKTVVPGLAYPSLVLVAGLRASLLDHPSIASPPSVIVQACSPPTPTWWSPSFAPRGGPLQLMACESFNHGSQHPVSCSDASNILMSIQGQQNRALRNQHWTSTA